MERIYGMIYEKGKPGVNLPDFDGMTVVITLDDSNRFKGECSSLPAEFCEAELGVNEEALQIDDWVFYKSQIIRIEPAAADTPGEWMSRTEHSMKLAPSPFSLIESGLKTAEIRLYDEKRKKVKAGDIIRFENTSDSSEILRVSVENVTVFPSFRELYCSVPHDKIGYTPDNTASASPDDMYVYYTRESEEKYGVCLIDFKLL